MRRRTRPTKSRLPTTAARYWCATTTWKTISRHCTICSESSSEAAAVVATAGALEQANYRYQGGLVTYLEVVTAEIMRFTPAIRGQHPVASHGSEHALVKALGGGWERAQ